MDEDQNEEFDLLDTPTQQVVGKVPPHSTDSEQSVLGAIMIDNEIINTVIEILRPEDFYKRNHQLIFEAMIGLYDRREPVDVVTLTEQLKTLNYLSASGGVDYLSHLLDIVPTSANTQFYAKIIKEMSIRRKLINEASSIVTEAMSSRGDIDSFIDSVEQRIFNVSDARTTQSFSHIGSIVKDSIKQIETLSFNQGAMTGVPSGFYDLDSITYGFQPGDLVIIAGRPSMGKTAFALSMAMHVGLAKQKPVAVFSLEMSKEQITMRLLCSDSKVSNSRVRSGKLAENDFPRLVDAASKLAASQIYIDDTPSISVLEMRAKARRLHRESPLSMIVVDYLQLMKGSSRKIERREQEISEISRGLKAIAKELSVPVIALSQLNRGVETRQDKRPIMADLRESGAIEQDADIIGFVYRDEVYNPDTPDKGVAEIIIAKHRNGPIGTIKLAFQAEFTLFVNLEQDSQDNYDYLGKDITIGLEEEELI
ncbi:MAG: replicative DNA helicase [Proteobacteria bacterium]|nr:replicative DNA helicase [Pseudomonadota bacterium]